MVNEKIKVLTQDESSSFFRRMRQESGLTQVQVSQLSGLNQTTISYIERNGFSERVNWVKVGQLLKLYAKHGAPSLFALVFKNGEIVTSHNLPEVYSGTQVAEAARAMINERLTGALADLLINPATKNGAAPTT